MDQGQGMGEGLGLQQHMLGSELYIRHQCMSTPTCLLAAEIME